MPQVVKRGVAHTELLFSRWIHGMAGRVQQTRSERRESLGQGAGDIAKPDEADRRVGQVTQSSLEQLYGWPAAL